LKVYFLATHVTDTQPNMTFNYKIHIKVGIVFHSNPQKVIFFSFLIYHKTSYYWFLHCSIK